MIAYDALLGCGGDWTELCNRSMFHGGEGPLCLPPPSLTPCPADKTLYLEAHYFFYSFARDNSLAGNSTDF